MDPIEQLLIKEYKMSPEQAKSAAVRIKSGQDPDSDNLKAEAVGPVPAQETERMATLKKKFELFTTLAKHRKEGRTLTDDDEKFYQDVKGHYANGVRERATKAQEAGRATGNIVGGSLPATGVQATVNGAQPPQPRKPVPVQAQYASRPQVPVQAEQVTFGPQAITAPIGGGQSMTVGQQTAPSPQQPMFSDDDIKRLLLAQMKGTM